MQRLLLLPPALLALLAIRAVLSLLLVLALLLALAPERWGVLLLLALLVVLLPLLLLELLFLLRRCCGSRCAQRRRCIPLWLLFVSLQQVWQLLAVLRTATGHLLQAVPAAQTGQAERSGRPQL